MANPFLSFTSSSFNRAESGYDAPRDYEKNIVGEVERDELSGTNNLGDIDTFCNEYGFYQDNGVEKLASMPEDHQVALNDHQPPFSSFGAGLSSAPLSLVDQLNFNDIRNRIMNVDDNKEGKGLSPSVTSLELLSNSPTKLNNREKASKKKDKTTAGGLKLSTDQILLLAGERFVQFSSQKFININVLMPPYSSVLTGLTEDDKQDVELVQLLLTAAEKVCYQQFDRARRLLSHCERLASNSGTPVRRAVFYFAEALRVRIERETGWTTSKGFNNKDEDRVHCSMWKYGTAIVAWYQEFPSIQATYFTGVQAMLETIAMKSKVHIIDIQMRSGVQWAVLLQAVAEQDTYPIEHLKLTVVETKDKQSVETTGRLLQSFARSLNLHFSFQVVFVSDMKDVRVEQFEADPEEAIIVYAPFVLCTMIAKPICLENLMKVIKRLDPSLMVVIEGETNQNSPTLVNRFIETLFYYGALFDCLEDGKDRNDQNRIAIEAGILRAGVHNIVAAEGAERKIRSVKIEVWRAFFARYDMVEVELSRSCLYQAHLVTQSFPNGNSCTLETKGKCLVVGWKGTPLYSLSIWKFG